jgi:hypothetical protein
MWQVARQYAMSTPSYRRARACVRQIVFLRGRILLRNELSEVFVSDDNGRSWRTLSEKPPTLTVANGNELWGAHGWPGHHEGPSASIWRSADRGETWSKKDVEVATARDAALYSLLPAGFVNEPGEPPLLLMSDVQIVRPELSADSSKWKRVGRRPDAELRPSKGTVNPTLAGRRYGRSIYVASAGHISLSNDDGMTWADEHVHPFFDARIRCVERACYALLSELGSEWNGLMITEAGSNDWKLLSTFGLSAVAQALAAYKSSSVVESFGATAMIATSEGVYVAGIVNAARTHRVPCFACHVTARSPPSATQFRRVSGSWSAVPTERFGQAARGRFDMRRANGQRLVCAWLGSPRPRRNR